MSGSKRPIRWLEPAAFAVFVAFAALLLFRNKKTFGTFLIFGTFFFKFASDSENIFECMAMFEVGESIQAA